MADQLNESFTPFAEHTKSNSNEDLVSKEETTSSSDKQSPEDLEGCVSENFTQQVKKPLKTHFYEIPDLNSPLGKLMLLWKTVKGYIRELYKRSCETPDVLKPTFERLDDYFECTRSGSSVEIEILAGIINFFSCCYVLAVVPQQMGDAGYNNLSSAAVVSFVTGLATLCSGIVTNTPLVVAPTTAVTIYFSINLQQYTLSTHSGSLIVMYGGVVIVALGLVSFLSRLISKFIPSYIQIGTTVGIGLITALSGYIELNVVVQGKYSLLTVGTITPEICIAMSGLVVIAVSVYYHSRFAYLFGLIWGTFFWWSSQNQWPLLVGGAPAFQGTFFGPFHDEYGVLVTFEMIFLIILTLFGLAKALCELAGITTIEHGGVAIPKGRLLLVVIGLANIGSGIIYGPPIILSPECASGIKAGARTGLSAVVAGVLFLLSMFLAPLFTAIPAAATSPVLIMIGMILFQNVKNIDFSTKYGIAAFVCLTLIPFTDSIIGGLGFAYATYLAISLLNGDVKKHVLKLWNYYFGPGEEEVEGRETQQTHSTEEGELEHMKSLPSRRGRGGVGGSQRESGASDVESALPEPIAISQPERKRSEAPAVEPTHPIQTRERRASSVSVGMQRIRRGTVAFLDTSLHDMNLENDIVRIDATRF